MGKKFKRQKPVRHYIVDFICFDPKLIVEIDGGRHAEQVEYDRRRDAYLHSEGFTVLRSGTPSPPAPLPQAGEGRLRNISS